MHTDEPHADVAFHCLQHLDSKVPLMMCVVALTAKRYKVIERIRSLMALVDDMVRMECITIQAMAALPTVPLITRPRKGRG